MNLTKIFIGIAILYFAFDSMESMMAVTNYENYIPYKFSEATYNTNGLITLVLSAIGIYILGKYELYR